MSFSVSWCAVDPWDGSVVAELPGLRLVSSATVLLGGSGGTVNVELPVADRLPVNWQGATEPHRTVLVATYDDPSRTVLWAGAVVSRTTGGPLVRLTLLDLPGLASRQFGQYLFDGTADAATAIGTVLSGAIDFGPSVMRTGDNSGYQIKYMTGAAESAVESADIMAARYGLEWSAYFRWQEGVPWMFNPGLRLHSVVEVAERLGRRESDTYEPLVLSTADWSRTEDWSAGKGATRVIAWGDPVQEGDAEFESAVAEDGSPGSREGMISLMESLQPPTSPTGGKPDLQRIADERLAELRHGTVSWDVRIVLAESDVLLGRDVMLGDDVTLALINRDCPVQDHEVRARLVGWTAEPDVRSGQVVSVSPIFVER